MNVRRMTMVVVLAGLALAPVSAMAQGPGHQMGMRGRMGSDSGSMMQMQGMMERMTEIHKRMTGMMTAPQAAPQTAPQPEKK